jgi:hypothetical protein
MRVPLAALLCLLPLQAAIAVELIEETFSLPIEPEASVTQDLACPDEQLISGGYAIESVTDDAFGDVFVTASTRHGAGSWRVGLYNDGDVPLTVDLSISIMCD